MAHSGSLPSLVRAGLPGLHHTQVLMVMLSLHGVSMEPWGIAVWEMVHPCSVHQCFCSQPETYSYTRSMTAPPAHRARDYHISFISQKCLWSAFHSETNMVADWLGIWCGYEKMLLNLWISDWYICEIKADVTVTGQGRVLYWVHC